MDRLLMTASLLFSYSSSAAAQNNLRTLKWNMYSGIAMSIFNNNNGERNRRAFFPWSNSDSNAAGVSIIIALTLLVSGFVLLSPTTTITTTTALAQEENNATTTITINGDADSDTDGSVDGAGGGNGNITSSTTNITAAPASSSGIELSEQPVYQVRSPEGDISPINQTHGILTFSGNGTLTLPNTTQTINTTSNGTAIISFMTSSGYGKETIMTQDGETVTAILYEIVQFNSASPAPEGSGGGEGKGIVTAVFQTNSTGMLAPLNGVIAAGTDDLSSSGESHITLWRWESGIGNSSGVAPPVQ
jgi:hypothetical protein